MAKVTITITDSVDNPNLSGSGPISVHLESDPPITKESDPNLMTPAQQAAGELVILFERIQGWDDYEDDEQPDTRSILERQEAGESIILNSSKDKKCVH